MSIYYFETISRLDGETMGAPKIIFLGGLLGGVFLLLMGWVSFQVLNLGDLMTGGLLTNISSLFSMLGDVLPGIGSIFALILPMFIGWGMLILFPLDWALTYRPDDIGLLFGILIPWAIAGVLTSLIFAKNAKQGFLCGIAIALYPIILMIVGSILLGFLSQGLLMGINIGGILDGIVVGLVDRSLPLAILSATLEGGALAGVFGALIGSLKYDPAKMSKGKKSKAKTKGKGEAREAGKKEDDFFVDFE